MKAIEIPNPGPPEALRLTDRPAPSPGPGEVLIAVEAPGMEVAGRISAIGPAGPDGDAKSASGRTWRVGDEVCALVAGGGYAELCVAPGVQCLPVPAGLSMIDAAAVPETFFTVWTNVFQRGRLAAGEWLLVHGGTSGIGTTAIQLAVARGAHVIATAGT